MRAPNGDWRRAGCLLEFCVRLGRGAVSAILLEMEGKVEISPAGLTTWTAGQTNQTLAAGDRVRTGERSRAVVRLSEKTLWRMGELTIVQIRSATDRRGGFNLLKGVLYFFHRDKPGTFPVETPSAYAVIIGTDSLIPAKAGPTAPCETGSQFF